MESCRQTFDNVEFNYVAVTNIPETFRTADLRAHFSSTIESEAFACFHFRHRPEKDTKNNKAEVLEVSQNNTSSNGEKPIQPTKLRKMCCIAKVYKKRLPQVLSYSNQNWTDADGEIYAEECEVSTVNVVKTAEEDEDAVEENVLLQMPELRPPELMVNGNVGTPTRVFLDLIQRCLLPHNLVGKLRLEFPKTRSKRLYDNVPFQYEERNCETSSHTDSQQRFHHLNKGKKSRASELEAAQFHKKTSPLDITCHVSSGREYRKDCCTDNTEKTTQMSEIQAQSSAFKFKTPVDKHSFEVRNKPECCGKSRSRKGNSAAPVASSTNNPSSNISMESSETNNEMSKHIPDCRAIEPAYEIKEAKDLSRMTKKQLKEWKKADRRKTREMMAEGIEERLINLERKYHNDDDAEEWDRHEASEDDPSNQERNKERLYEEEIEQPWEKGGPGVVFYTDAIYWQAQEGDFDEQTTDDLDVDHSAYEEPGAGDMDIKDFLKIRQEARFRSGYDNTDRFSIGIGRRVPPTGSKQGCIGSFEQHTKGVGRRVMERQGWREGAGLGRSKEGIAEALRGTGQGPHNKRGLGYVESDPVHYGSSKKKKVHLISTVYDNPTDTDPKEHLLCRSEPTTLKHRHSHSEAFQDVNKKS